MPRRLTSFPIIAGLALAGAAITAPAVAQADIETSAEGAPVTKGERQLARLLEGRVAGEPVRCIRTFPSQRMKTIPGTAYVYGQGDTLFVQRTRNPDQIDNNESLVTNRFNAIDLCRFDVMITVDPVTGIFTGSVFFEDFVPYTRVKVARAGD